VFGAVLSCGGDVLWCAVVVPCGSAWCGSVLWWSCSVELRSVRWRCRIVVLGPVAVRLGDVLSGAGKVVCSAVVVSCGEVW
jgi:hypothetical protein